MEAYTGFAQVYDKFMDNIEYDKWCEYLVSILKEYGVNYGIVLDLSYAKFGNRVGRQGLRYDWRGLLPGNA